MGISTENSSSYQIKRAKVALGNNGFLIGQLLKRRVWWNVVKSDIKKEDETGIINLFWTSNPPSLNSVQKIV